MKKDFTIVIAEDSTMQSQKLENLLTQNNYNVMAAKNGIEAISLIRSKKIDLIISDVAMPEMDGYTLCRKVKQDSLLSFIPVILLSSMNSSKDIIQGIESGVDYYLTKPYDDEYLIDRIKFILSGAILPWNGASPIGYPSIFNNIKEDIHDNRPGAILSKQKMINLLVCTYENSLQINKKLIKTQAECRELNKSLEKRISERTSMLENEVSVRKKNEQIFKAVIEDTPAMICRFKPDGCITFVNEHFSLAFNRSCLQMMGKNLYNLIPAYKELELKEIAEILKSENPVMAFEYKIKSRDGSIFYHECYIRALFDSKKLLTEFQSLAIDITEQAKVKAEKETLENQLTQMQTMETMGKLASGIAHDFNNILSPLMGHTEMALALSYSNEEACKHLTEAIKAAHRARDLIQNILAFGRKLPPNPRGIRLQDVISESLSLIKTSMPIDIIIKQNIDMACGHVVADATQMQRIIINLCMNALHSMKQNGGILGMDLSEINYPCDLSVKTDHLSNKRYVHLQISDTGCGIDPAIIERIFEPFFTTKGAVEGTGLGLSSVKEIIKNYNGDVLVDSALGKGSVFHVFLPSLENANKELSLELDQPAKTQKTDQ